MQPARSWPMDPDSQALQLLPPSGTISGDTPESPSQSRFSPEMCGLSVSSEKYKPCILAVFWLTTLFSDITISLSFSESGATSGTRENKSSKRLVRADAVIYEYFTLLCVFCSIIQKAIHVDAENASSWI